MSTPQLVYLCVAGILLFCVGAAPIKNHEKLMYMALAICWPATIMCSVGLALVLAPMWLGKCTRQALVKK